jgi:hypothetical protein
VAVYVIFVDTSLITALRGIFTLLLIPLMTVGISYIFSFLFFKLGSKMPNPQAVTSFLSILMVVAFLYFNFSTSGNYATTPRKRWPCWIASRRRAGGVELSPREGLRPC